MAWFEDLAEDRLRLGPGVTPLLHYPSLSEELGVDVHVKHDDRLDHVAGGNKVRKLEFLLARARRENADTILTAGSADSNQNKAVAYYARRLGMHCRLLVFDDGEPGLANGNHLMCRLMGADIEWLSPRRWPGVDELLAESAERLRASGRSPFVIRPGGSEWPGTLGYVDMAAELAAQERAEGLSFDHVVLPTGSGGTHTGLLVGAVRQRRDWQVHGVCVTGSARELVSSHDELLRQIAERWGPVPSGVRDAGLHVHEGALGPGYGRFDAAHARFVQELAARHGLLVDPIYMGKAVRGLFDLVGSGRIEPGSSVVLVHTGGMFTLFGNNPDVRATLQHVAR